MAAIVALSSVVAYLYQKGEKLQAKLLDTTAEFRDTVETLQKQVQILIERKRNGPQRD